MTLKEISEFLGGQLFGEPDIEISGLAKIDEAVENEITFLSNLKYQHLLASSGAGAVIVDQKIESSKIPYILVQNAYIAFVFLLKRMNPPEENYFSGVSPQAVIDETAHIEDGAVVGPLAYVGPGVKVGKNTMLYPGVVLLRNVTIGDDCILYPNVSVREECRVGDRVILHNGCVIGSDGFGFAPKAGSYVKIPQLGNVILEDDVEIQANSTIDRATLGSTIIQQGTKLDNLVQVAHNAKIGKNTVIAAQSGVSGSTEIGDNVTIAGQVGIAGHLKVGKKAILAAQSGISKNVEENAVLFGTPAQPIMKQKRIDVSLRHLPDLLKKIQSLEKELLELKNQISKEN